MATVGRGAEQYTVRFPDGLRDRIKSAAEANNRSMNAEIVARLEASLSSTNAGGVTFSDAEAERVAGHLRDYIEVLKSITENSQKTSGDD